MAGETYKNENKTHSIQIQMKSKYDQEKNSMIKHLQNIQEKCILVQQKSNMAQTAGFFVQNTAIGISLGERYPDE